MSANQPEKTIEEAIKIYDNDSMTAGRLRDQSMKIAAQDKLVAALSAMVSSIIDENEYGAHHFATHTQRKRNGLRAEQRQRAAKLGFKL